MSTFPKGRMLYKTKRRHSAARSIQKAFRKRSLRTRRGFRVPLALAKHNFVERLPDVTLGLNATTLDANGNLLSTHTNTFQVSDIPQILSYSKLFEYYKIDKIVVTYRYKCAGVPGAYIANPLNTQIFQEINPTILFKVDHNDAVAQTVADLKQSARLKEKQLTNSMPNFTITLKPAVQSEAYKSLTASTYIPKWNQWLSMADTTVPHYGLKMQIQCPAPQANYNYGSLFIQKKIYFSVKNNE